MLRPCAASVTSVKLSLENNLSKTLSRLFEWFSHLRRNWWWWDMTKTSIYGNQKRSNLSNEENFNQNKFSLLKGYQSKVKLRGDAKIDHMSLETIDFIDNN